MDWLYSFNGTLGRGSFTLRLVVILMVGAVASYGAYLAGYHGFHHFVPVGIWFALLVALTTLATAYVQVVRRMRDIGIPPFFVWIPVYNLYILVLLFVKPGKG
ncbi:MAG: DUF805 domain-containing protein [Opitutales bacterium]